MLCCLQKEFLKIADETEDKYMDQLLNFKPKYEHLLVGAGRGRGGDKGVFTGKGKKSMVEALDGVPANCVWEAHYKVVETEEPPPQEAQDHRPCHGLSLLRQAPLCCSCSPWSQVSSKQNY